MNQTYNQDVAVPQTANFSMSFSFGEKPVEWSDVTQKWQLLDIKKYLLACKSKEKALVIAERMTGIWTQLVIMEMVEPVVYEKNGNIAWQLDVLDNKCNMLTYLTNVINMFFGAGEMVSNARKKLNELENNESATKIESNSEYEAIAKEELAPFQSVFEKYKLRERIPSLSKLTDAQYDKLCLKLYTANPAMLMALIFVLGFLNHIKDEDNTDAVFGSQNELFKMLVKATGKYTSNTISQELYSITKPDSKYRESHNAWKCIDEAQNILNNL